MQTAGVADTDLKSTVIRGVVIRDKVFLHVLEKVLELKWLHDKNQQTRKAVIETTLPSIALGAVENTDFVALQALLEEVHVNFGNYDGMRPLHTACELGNIHMVKFLLQKGASPQLLNSFGRCPLHLAIKNRQYKVVKLLQMKGFTVHLNPVRIAMEMINAVRNRDYPLLHAWFLSGVDMDSKDYNSWTAMHEAVSLQDKYVISKLLEYEATPLERNVWGQTALDDAQNEPSIISLFHPLFTVHFPTKEAFLQYKAKHLHK